MSPERDFAHTLDEALEALAQGQSLPTILARYPEEADRLTPLLAAAQTVLRTPFPQPPAGAEAASKARMMRGLGEKKASFTQHKEDIIDDVGAGFQRQRGKNLILMLLMLTLIFIFLSTLTVAALSALPDSPLYSIKLALQDARVLVTFNPTLRQARAAHYYELRLQDLQKAVELGRLPQDAAQASQTAMPTPQPTSTLRQSPSTP